MTRYSLNNVEFTKDVVNKILDNDDFPLAILEKMPRRGVFDISYGLDHACGYFIQFFPREDNELAMDEMLVILGWQDECINIDGVFDDLSGSDLGFILKIFNAPKQHIENAFLDLPI